MIAIDKANQNPKNIKIEMRGIIQLSAEPVEEF